MVCLRFSLRRSSLDCTITLAVLLTWAARLCTERLAILFGELAAVTGDPVPEDDMDDTVFAVVGVATVRGSTPGPSTGDVPSETALRCSPLHLKTREMASEYFTRRRSSSIECACMSGREPAVSLPEPVMGPGGDGDCDCVVVLMPVGGRFLPD